MFTIDKDSNAMTIIKKDTATISLSLDNYNLVDGDVVKFTVATELESQTPVISKEITAFTDGAAVIELTTTDTNITEGSYFYDIQVSTTEGVVDTVVGPAKFVVKGGVTY